MHDLFNKRRGRGFSNTSKTVEFFHSCLTWSDMKDWPPNPGSTVMISTKSSSSQYGNTSCLIAKTKKTTKKSRKNKDES